MIVDTYHYLTMIKELLKQDKQVSLPIKGNSMAPFLINNRDYIYLEKPKNTLKKGDFVLYQRISGQYVAHRIVKTDGNQYYLAGDNQTVIEGPIYQKQILGIVTKVKRKEKWLKEGDLYWEFFEHVWRYILPWRRLILSIYKKYRLYMDKLTLNIKQIYLHFIK